MPGMTSLPQTFSFKKLNVLNGLKGDMLNVTSLYFMSKFGFKSDAISSLFFSRLYVLQGGLAQQEWRVPELLHRLLQYLEPKLTQVYKNVSERIGRYVLECKNQVNINMYFHHLQTFQSHCLLLFILSLILSCLSVCSPTSS